MPTQLTEAKFVAQAMALADTALFARAEQIAWGLVALGPSAAHYWRDDLSAALQARCDHARERLLNTRLRTP